MDINELIGGLDNPKLKNSIKELASSPQGKELMNKLNGMDKNQILNYVKSMNSSKVPADAIIKQINNNPNIINQLNDFLSKKR